jgi:peptidyl-tRNA hydrolase
MRITTELYPLDYKQPEWTVLENLDLKKKSKKYPFNNKVLDDEYSPGSWKIVFLLNNEYLTQLELVEYWKKYIFIYKNSEKNEQLILSLFNKILTNSLNEGIKKIRLEGYPEYNTLNLSNPQVEQILSLEYSLENLVEIKYPKQTRKPKYSIKDFLRYNTFLLVKSEKLRTIGPISIFIITRSDLKIGKGKLGAQIAHGMISLIFRPRRTSTYLNKIMKDSYPDMEVYSAPNIKVLEEMEKKAQALNVNEVFIADAGHTQVISGTKTVLAIGPAPKYYLEKFIEQWENIKRIH